MTDTQHNAAERAALFMSGALSTEEQRQFLEELSRDGALSRELAELQAVAHALAEEVEPVEPGDHVRRELIRFAREQKAQGGRGDGAQIWRDWQSDERAGLFTVRGADAPWEQTGVEGIEVRRLFVDREHDRMTVMFRMAAGSWYVPHRHEGPEECYVLEGDLYVGEDLVLHAGDYQRAEAGSLHGIQRTESGCTILVTCSLHDEPL